MKKWISGVVVFIFFVMLSNMVWGSSVRKDKILAMAESMSKDAYVQGEVIVKFKQGILEKESSDIHRSIGAQVIRRIKRLRIEVIKIPKDMTVIEAIKKYMENPAVEYAEPNYKRRILIIPNDPYFSQQWSLHNEGKMMNAVADADMDMPEAWDIKTGSKDFVVAVIDTGIDYGHPELGPNMWTNEDEIANNGIDDDNNGYVDDTIGWDFGDKNNDPMDNYGHGTHVAGIIGAVGNNGKGISGINWKIRIMALKVADENLEISDSNIIEAIDYAVKNGANVINASLGGYGYSQSMYDIISDADKKGVLFIAAAGNETNDNDLKPIYPASYNLANIISVAASDQDDQLADFSNYGKKSVHVVAPGNHTLSTMPRDRYTTGYDTWEGTSMAAPHVAGLAALLMDYYRHFDIYQIKKLIINFVDKLPQFNEYVSSGGRVNAYNSISALLKPENLTSEAVDSKVKLKWIDKATGEEGYKVERKAEGESSFQVIATVKPTDTQVITATTVEPNTMEFVDNNVEVKKSYTYRVRAFNSIGYSEYSNETTIVVPSGGGGGGGCSVTPIHNVGLDMSFFLLIAIISVWLARKRWV